MNEKLILRVADAIEAEQLTKFDMDTWACGTSACIAGWAVMLNDGVSCEKLSDMALNLDSPHENWTTYTPGRAQIVMDLSNQQADELFTNEPTGTSKHDAATALRRLVETGVARW